MVESGYAQEKKQVSVCDSNDKGLGLCNTNRSDAGLAINRSPPGAVVPRSLLLAAHKALKPEFSGLQVIPAVAIKLLKLTNDENASFDELSRVIETEPSLSVEVLRLVNSAYYGLPGKVNSIKRAVTLAGFSMVRQVALNLMFFKKLKSGSRGRRFNQMSFWQHSLFVASMSKIIATAIHHPEPDRVYSAGLLHDVGKVLLETFGKASYSDFLQSFEKSENSLLENETCFFGINHAQLGAAFCHEYGLPDSITLVALNHHNALFHHNALSEREGFDPDILKDTAIVSFSDFIASIQGLSSTGKNYCGVPPPGLLDFIRTLSLNLESILDKVDDEVRGLSAFYNLPFPGLSTLRANIVHSVLCLGQPLPQDMGLKPTPVPGLGTALTAPHHSLDPDDFIPWTLEAIQHDFNVDRLFMLCIDPEIRSLVAKYQWPENRVAPGKNSSKGKIELKISSLSGNMLSCLRRREAVHIGRESLLDRSLLDVLSVEEFFAIPVLTHNRLFAVLYIDNAFTGNRLDVNLLPELNKVAVELGVALVNARQYEQEKKKARFDPLTGLNNRSMITRFLTYLFGDAGVKLDRLAIGFVDIDHFKQFNDLYGHQSGDDVLRIVADCMKSLTRPGDFLGRFGGEEFLFVLLHTDKQGAIRYAERIRREIAEKGRLLQHRFPDLQLTASIGVALYDDSYDEYRKMIEVADEAMYQAKNNGRNQVVVC
ncbi:MAG: diguanylate cyclase [Proteobacteria bacterium]|nr:MAG: diguanylate cyclase [Pseudomonadota bacterium]